MYVGLGSFSGFALIHVVVQRYVFENERADFFPCERIVHLILIMGALYIVGCQFYIFKFPERMMPGFFDIWLNSHTIWHMFVFAAACVHMYTLLETYSIRSTISCLPY